MNGALPWDDPEHYRKSSPIYDLHKVRTPTIIHVGGADPRVPAAHSRALYRALRHYLDVPVELVVYPNMGHGLTKYEYRKAKMMWDLAWFDKYLLARPGKRPKKKPRKKRTAGRGDRRVEVGAESFEIEQAPPRQAYSLRAGLCGSLVRNFNRTGSACCGVGQR